MGAVLPGRGRKVWVPVLHLLAFWCLLLKTLDSPNGIVRGVIQSVALLVMQCVLSMVLMPLMAILAILTCCVSINLNPLTVGGRYTYSHFDR